MKNTPAYIMRNCALWVNEDVKVGQASEMGVTLPKEVTDKLRNAGMIKSRTIAMGYELEGNKFKLTAFDPATLRLIAPKTGPDIPIMVTGALVDEDGTVTNATFYGRGRIHSADAGSWKPGDKAELDCEMTLNYAKLEVGGEEIFEIDDFNYTLGGESQTGDIRAALLLS